MRIAICTGPREIIIVTRPIPRIDEEKVLVKVALCGICGSDLAVWQGTEQKYPYSPGHEFSGTVVEVGSRVRGIDTGQRVVIDPNLGCGRCPYCTRGLPNLCDYLKSRPTKSNGGFSEYVALDCRMVHSLPSTLTEEQAAFVEPLSCALHAVEIGETDNDEVVAVFGGGILGVLVGIALASRDRKFFYVEPLEDRRLQLQELLAAPCLAPAELAGYSRDEPFSVAIDCSGSAAAVSQAVQLLDKAGTLVLAGVVQSDAPALPIHQITKKELKLRGSWLNPHTFADAIALAGQSRTVLDRLETRTYALPDIEAAFACAEEKQHNKVFVRP
jgi:L-iditol 2-dehydrogenase